MQGIGPIETILRIAAEILQADWKRTRQRHLTRRMKRLEYKRYRAKGYNRVIARIMANQPQ